jgi:prepilin-type N-terminal cleavage/methylation domain-containing protein
MDMDRTGKGKRLGRARRGFTLVEMMVAVALFSIVMMVSITALLSLIDANRKAQALQSVINNLNVTLDGLVRAVREGSNYRCGSQSPSDPNCPEGGTTFYFTPFSGNPSTASDDWVYTYDPVTKRIYKSEDGTLINALPVTSPEVSIDSATFFVIGATQGDNIQPKVMLVVKGTAGGQKIRVRTTFHVQSTAVQRVLDI